MLRTPKPGDKIRFFPNYSNGDHPAAGKTLTIISTHNPSFPHDGVRVDVGVGQLANLKESRHRISWDFDGPDDGIPDLP